MAAALVLVAGPLASGKDLGTDVLGNIAPAPQVGSGALSERYPLSAFQARLPHADRDHPARWGAADDRALGRGAAVEPVELPGQDDHRPVHVGVLAEPARRRAGAAGRGVGAGRQRDHEPV